MARPKNTTPPAAAAPELEAAELPLASLVPNPKNARRHPPEQLQQLAASVRRFGQPRPILVRRANRMIVAGHGISQACEAAGLELVRVLLWDVDQAKADAFMLADNRLAALGTDDKASVARLLREIGVGDLEGLGYTAADFDKLTADAADDIDVVEIPTGTVADRFWISVRGPLAMQAQALAALQKVMAEIPGVEVEQGTVPDGQP